MLLFQRRIEQHVGQFEQLAMLLVNGGSATLVAILPVQANQLMALVIGLIGLGTSKGRGEKLDLIAAALFGLIHGLIAVFEQLLLVFSMFGVKRNADTASNRQWSAVAHFETLIQPGMNFLGDG